MSLFKKGTSFEVDSVVLKKSMSVPFVKLATAKSSWSKKSIYDDCVDLCNKCIALRQKPKDSFMIFGMVFGEHSPYKVQADKIWSDAWILYKGSLDDDDVLFEFLKKVFGTILMIQVANDSGVWEYEPDPDKISKLTNKEVPDAAIYNLRKSK